MQPDHDRSFSLTRKWFLAGTAALVASPGVISKASAANATPPMSADAALAKLKAGNVTFVKEMAGTRLQTIEERAALGQGQTPYAAILSCADSRTTPEIIFSEGLGDLFVVRVAGNVASATERASLEYAAAVLKTPLIVVMGHSSCGAVKAAIDLTKGQTFPGDIQELARLIEPAAKETKDQAGDWLKNATLENIKLCIGNLRASAVLDGLVTSGALKLVGAYYEVNTGVVTFS